MSLDRLAPHLLHTRAWLSRNSRALSAGFVLVLGGFAAAAFGVAPLLPDPADQPQSLVINTVAPPGNGGNGGGNGGGPIDVFDIFLRPYVIERGSSLADGVPSPQQIIRVM